MATRIMEVELEGVPLEVTFSYYKACRGRRDKYGVPLEPDEPEDVEIENVRVGSISIIDMLVTWQIEKIEGLIKEALD